MSMKRRVLWLGLLWGVMFAAASTGYVAWRGRFDPIRGPVARAESPEARVDLVTDGFGTFFGVRGTLVVKRGRGPNEWIEASQGLSSEVAACVSAKIQRRWRHRGIRPFLARIPADGEDHQVACLPVEIGDGETNLALDLIGAPSEPGMREALMNLLGAAMRGANIADRLRQIERDLDAERSGFRGVLEMAGGVSHKINQPLMIINNLLSEVLSDIREDDPHCRKLEMVSNQLMKLNKIAEKIRGIEKYVTMEYVGGVKIVDIDRSAALNGGEIE